MEALAVVSTRPSTLFLFVFSSRFLIVTRVAQAPLQSNFMNCIISFSALLAGCSLALGSDLRIGIIGCDTSHVLVFTETLNNPAAKGHVPGAKVVGVTQNAPAAEAGEVSLDPPPDSEED